MSPLLLERPSATRERPARPRRSELFDLRRRLEAWLPAEEQQLVRARLARRPLPEREARWQQLLGLYERLCRTLPAVS